MNKFLKIFSFLALCNFTLLHSATVYGKITDFKTNQPLSGANVFITVEGELIGGVSDVDGDYQIENTPEGTHNLEVTYVGYKNHFEVIEIGSRRKYEVNIQMNSKAIQSEEILITEELRKEKKTEAPASKEVIRSEDIKKVTNTNLGGYLKGLKGVDFTSSGINNYSISIRGFNSSFSTRLLMLTDGRVANIPALRVINFSTIPQSSEDVERIEVVLGPATASYGANAHSGVINIISKPPSTSEGFNASFSGSSDDRQLQKFNTRYAKKIGDFSFKFSGEYVHANEWPYISESEYKLHRYPWSGNPERAIDGKDNNPWQGIPASGGNFSHALTAVNNYGNEVMIGNGEANHGDIDGDGVAGEDWFNGYDDDGDSFDDDGDGFCNGQEMQWAIENGVLDQEPWNNPNDFPTGPAEDFSNWIDEDYFYSDGIDNQEPYTDTNQNSVYDEGESFEDWNGDGVWTGPNWIDYNENGIQDAGDLGIDEYIDGVYDDWYDGVDNNLNGAADENTELRTDPTTPTGNWALSMENYDIIINGGRKLEYLDSNRNGKWDDGEDNPFYNPNDWDDYDVNGDGIINEEAGDCFSCIFAGEDQHIRGSMRYDEDRFKLEYDLFIYDYGDDGIAGDPWIDLSGNDGVYHPGESLSTFSPGAWFDNGLDGIAGTNDEGEGDGIWQPGDSWVDDGDGVANAFTDDYVSCFDVGNDGFCWGDEAYTEENFNDVWPPGDGIWQEGEELLDYGNDGYQWDPNNEGWEVGNPYQALNIDGSLAADDNGNPVILFGPDAGEGDGILIAHDINEYDGILDTGDGVYGGTGLDANGDGDYSDYGDIAPDYIENFDVTYDVNGDGVSDYPDFEVENKKAEFRLDYDPNPDLNLTFQTGYSWTKTQQVTGIGRFIAEGWESTYYQMRGRYKSWYGQAFYNLSNSGSTRNYNIGQMINDQSKNLGLQIQNEFFVPNINTEVTWGFDYSKTMPETFGTILNDGPNGYDEDGDNAILESDGIDNDFDGIIDEEKEGIDEPGEYFDIESNEYGGYIQTTTDVLGDEEWELVVAARFDHHDQLDEGLQFGPKFGLNYRPNDENEWRLTYGLAFNTPTITTLYTDLYYGKQQIFDVFLKGNKDGTPYARVPLDGLDGTGQYFVDGEPYSYSVNPYGPGYWSDCVGEQCDENIHYTTIPQYSDVFTDGYQDRILGAPFFFNINDNGPNDYIPLDTARHYIYVPFADGDGGVSYTAAESFDIPDVDPLGPERMQTLELGYKGKISKSTLITADLYISQFDDFFSPATIVTPLIKRRSDGATVGMLPVSTAGSNPPYGTAWDGQDNDNDWEGYYHKFIEDPYDSDGFIDNTEGEYMYWNEAFEWDDDKDGDGIAMDPGEWGWIEWVYDQDNQLDTLGYTIWRPEDVLTDDFIFSTQYEETVGDRKGNLYWFDVGIDEYSIVTGLNEAELINLGLVGSDGIERVGPGRPTAPPNIVLSSLNYGQVMHTGLDISIRQFINTKMLLDCNFAIFGATDYYNVLTKRYDPINAPKFKFNSSLKWDSKIGDIMISYRYVDKFDWMDGIWSGTIGPYNIVDIHFNRQISENLGFSISAMNVFNDVHRQLIGGAKMGRQIVLRMTSSF